MLADELANLERVRAAVHEQWASEEQVANWRRRHPQLDVQSRAATDLLVAAAGIAPGRRVLDLACGTGEPALTIARLVGPAGSVTGIDLSPPMLAEARERAAELGLANATFQASEAEHLPYPDASFDVVTCRFGVMYFWDPARALREARRVLRPGGAAAFVVWAAPECSPVFINLLVARRYRDIPPPREDAPNRFRFARPGSLSAALRAAGFGEVRETRHIIPWPTYGALAEIQAGAPFHELIDELPASDREQARREALVAMSRYFDGRCCHYTAAIVVASARVAPLPEG